LKPCLVQGFSFAASAMHTISPPQHVKGIVGGYFFTTFAKQKIQLWEEVIKKPRKVKYSKGLLEKQDLPVKRKLQVTNLRLKRKAKQLAG
jgi:hypothetical protein